MIEREERDGILVLRMAHGKVNAIDVDLCDALADAIEELESSTARAAVLTGAGTVFSAGVNLFRVVEEGGDYVDRFLPALDRGFRTLFAASKPVVAAINGHAIAGGCVLAAACDRRLMVDDAGRIGIPELLVGVPFPTLALEIMRSALPASEFRAAVFTGANHSPDEALRRGFVDGLAPAGSLIDAAVAEAGALGAIRGESYAITKRAMRAPYLDAVDDAIDAEVAAAWKDPSTLRTIRDYLERTLGKKKSG